MDTKYFTWNWKEPSRVPAQSNDGYPDALSGEIWREALDALARDIEERKLELKPLPPEDSIFIKNANKDSKVENERADSSKITSPKRPGHERHLTPTKRERRPDKEEHTSAEGASYDELDTLLRYNELLTLEPLERIAFERQIRSEDNLFGPLHIPPFYPNYEKSESASRDPQLPDEVDLEKGTDANKHTREAKEKPDKGEGSETDSKALILTKEDEATQIALQTERHRRRLLDDGLYITNCSKANIQNRAIRVLRLLRQNLPSYTYDYYFDCLDIGKAKDRKGPYPNDISTVILKDPNNLVIDASRRMLAITAQESTNANRIQNSNATLHLLSPQSLTGKESSALGEDSLVLYREKPPQLVQQASMLLLNLHLSDVRFDDHPVYNEEDVLAVRADELYNEYKTRVAIDLISHHNDRVDALLRVAKSYRDEYQRARKDGVAQRERYYLSKLIGALEQSITDRELRDKEELELRMLFKQLYDVWGQIRRVRESHGKSSHARARAPHRKKLDQRRDKIDGKKENKEDNTQRPPPKEEMNPEQKETNDDNSPKFSSVVSENQVFNPMQLRVKKIKLSKTSEQVKYTKDFEEELRTREEIFSLRQRQKWNKADPNSTAAPPPIPDYRKRIEERMNRSRKRPGRPLYVPIVRETALSITPIRECGETEQQRRKREAQTRIYLLVKVNGRTVMRTASVNLERRWPRLFAPFNEALNLRLHGVPKSVTVEIMQEGLLGGYRLAECQLSLPDPASINIKSMKLKLLRGGPLPSLESLNGSAVGAEEKSGHRLKYPRFVRGELTASMQWELSNRSSDQKRLMAAAQAGATNNPPGQTSDRETLVDREHVRRKVGRYEDVFSISKQAFRLQEMPEELQLRHDGPESLRKQVLRGRHLGHAPTGLLVPLEDRDIPHQMCQYAAKKNAMKNRLKVPVETGDVVRETVPWILTLGMEMVSGKVLSWMFEAERLLRPQRQIEQPIANPRSCRITVQILRGQNIPVRKDYGSGDNFNSEEKSRVWIEASFKGRRRRTSTASGSNPYWNELLSLQLKKPNEEFGFSPHEMLNVTDSITLNIYDRFVKRQAVNGGGGHAGGHTVTQVWEEQWLGTAELPFSAVYLCRPVYAALPVYVPPQSLGYKLENPRSPSRLWVYVTLDPLLSLPPGFAPGQTSSELPESWWKISPFHRHCRSFLQRAKRASPIKKRHVVTLVPNLRAEPNLCCQYVRPLPPPKGLEEPKAFTRFVATIPYHSDNWGGNNARAIDYWCTANEFLTLGHGDEEEHALLLCNYFKYRENATQSELARGGGLHAAPTTGDRALDPKRWHTFVSIVRTVTGLGECWVLRIGPSEGQGSGTATQKRRVLIYNPTDGARYDVYRDHATLPLIAIDSLFDADNVWANLQTQEEPWLNEFDLRNRSHWMSLFGRSPRLRARFAKHTLCIQSPVTYHKIGEKYYQARAAEIERIIEQRFERWRSAPTKWDYGVAGVLRESLRGMEEAAISSGMRGAGNAIRETKGLERVKHLYKGIQGFPLRFKDCPDKKHTVDSEENFIVETVRRTRLHDRRHKGNLFALAVYIHPYPNQIGSCWVYIAALPSVS